MAGVAEAQIALGQLPEARETLADLEERALRQWGPDHLLSGIGHLAQARWHAARKDWPAARERVDRAESIWTRLGPPASPYVAQAKALRASWAQAGGS
jgi:eukaryotic-like serine/threonine-protein kinase